MKLNYFGTDKPLNYFNTDKQVVIPEKFNLKPFRAFWISNVLNIDLPNMKDPSYKDKVIEMLDTAKAYNMTGATRALTKDMNGFRKVQTDIGQHLSKDLIVLLETVDSSAFTR